MNLTLNARSLRSLTPNNPWRRIDLKRGSTVILPIQSPDKYQIQVSLNGRIYQSESMPLKELLTKHPSYVVKTSLAMAAPANQRPLPKVMFTICSPKENDYSSEIYSFETR